MKFTQEQKSRARPSTLISCLGFAPSHRNPSEIFWGFFCHLMSLPLTYETTWAEPYGWGREVIPGAVRVCVAGFISRQCHNKQCAPYLQCSPRCSCSGTQVENPGDLSLSCITHAELRTMNCTALRMMDIQTGLLWLTTAHKHPGPPFLHLSPLLLFRGVPPPLPLLLGETVTPSWGRLGRAVTWTGQSG